MRRQLYRITLFSILTYLALCALNSTAAAQPSGEQGVHYCGFTGFQLDETPYDQSPNRRYARANSENLNVGEPRTVRMIYFLPNDRPYRADVVQKMKDEMRNIQTFYTEQMEAHGYGNLTFRYETDAQGEPMVHRVDGVHADNFYVNYTFLPVKSEINMAFDLNENIYLTVIDHSADDIEAFFGARALGAADPMGKNGGFALIPDEFSFTTAAHELGHTFDLPHDFRDGAYIMSYGLRASLGPPQSQLSECHGEFLSIHPYFNLSTSTDKGESSSIELISPVIFSVGSQSVPVRLKVSNSAGLHQVFLLAGGHEVKACQALVGEKDAVVEFDYDGVIPSDGLTSLSNPDAKRIQVNAVDVNVNVSRATFWLREFSPHRIATFRHKETVDRVNSVSISPNGLTVASGGGGGVVQLWDVAMERIITTFKHARQSIDFVSFSPNGSTLATGGADTVQLWDVRTGRTITTFKHATFRLPERDQSVSFTPDGMVFAAFVNDETVQVWDVATQQHIANFKHTERVIAVSFSADASILAAGGDDGTVHFWDVATGHNVATFRDRPGWVTSLAFSHDGETLATGGWEKTQLWNVATQQHIVDLMEGNYVWIESVAFTRDGKTLATGASDGAVKLWDISTKAKFAILHHDGRVKSLAFSPDGKTVVSGTTAGTTELWDAYGLLEGKVEIDIPDSNLRAAIADAIYVSANDIISRADMANLFKLDASNVSISNLIGLESATHLESLDLSNNNIFDISAVADLTNLKKLNFWNNDIFDISAVAGLKNLRELNLSNNDIFDISAVADLTYLRNLNFWNNDIFDISAVAGLKNLRELNLSYNDIFDISAVADLTYLRNLNFWNNDIFDISAVAGLKNLRELNLSNNDIFDISAVAGLKNLRELNLGSNDIFDISAVADLTNLRKLDLAVNNITDISALSGLTNLTSLSLFGNDTSDISALSGLTNLTSLSLGGYTISDLSVLSGLTNLAFLNLSNSEGSDVSALSSLINLKELVFAWNNFADISMVSGLTHVKWLQLPGNGISDLSAVAGLKNLELLNLTYNNITDISPLVSNTGLGAGDNVNLRHNPLSYESIYTHIPTLQERGVEVNFDNRTPHRVHIVSGNNQKGRPGEALEKPFVVEVKDQNGQTFEGVPVAFSVTTGGGTLSVTSTTTDANGRAESTLTLGSTPGVNTVHASVEGNTEISASITIVSASPMFTLSIPAGTHAINIPLDVNQINGEDGTIETVGDVYDALGDAVNFIITFVDGTAVSYLGDESAGSRADADIYDDTGLIAVMKSTATLELVGDALGTGGESRIDIGLGNNLLGVPLDSSVDMMISDLLLVEGVAAIAVSNAAGDGFNTISKNNLAADGPVIGGVAYIVVATAETSIPVMGSAWENEGAAAAPAVVFSGTQTPVLYVQGGVIDEFDMLSRIPNLRVAVKNLSSGASLDTVLGTEASKTAYGGTFVELSRRAAKVGDVLEIVAHSANPYVGVRPPPQIVVSVEEVLASRIKLPDLELYEIPSENELLANYPNPFNPETWIPFRLAKAAEVTLEIYDTNGRTVRSIDVGFKPAAVYESRTSAIYWDGRNSSGESVASGVYFYYLSAGTHSATRKMLIMK